MLIYQNDEFYTIIQDIITEYLNRKKIYGSSYNNFTAIM